MAKRGFQIVFPDIGPAGIHRIRNWAENLYWEVSRKGWGTVEDLDRATDTVWVFASSARVTGDLAKAIRRTLRHAHLLEQATIAKFSVADPNRSADPIRT